MTGTGKLEDIGGVKTWDFLKLKAQRDLRIKLRGEMVGTLYPHILMDEVCKISGQMNTVSAEARRKRMGR